MKSVVDIQCARAGTAASVRVIWGGKEARVKAYGKMREVIVCKSAKVAQEIADYCHMADGNEESFTVKMPAQRIMILKK